MDENKGRSSLSVLTGASSATTAQPSPTQFNGKYSSEMHREVPKTRRSALVIHNKNSSMPSETTKTYSMHQKDRNAMELIKFISKAESGGREMRSHLISELAGINTTELSVEEVIAKRESRRASIQMPSSLGDSRRKALKRSQQLILYLRHTSSCQNEYCTASTYTMHSPIPSNWNLFFTHENYIYKIGNQTLRWNEGFMGSSSYLWDRTWLKALQVYLQVLWRRP